MHKLVVAAYVLVFVGIIPFLEISETHLLNPHWPAHARLHEAWQLITNGAFTTAACFLAWRTSHALLAQLLCLPLSISFILAWALQGFYGGSMLHSDGSEIAIFGVNVAVLIVFVLIAGSALAIAAVLRARKPGG